MEKRKEFGNIGEQKAAEYLLKNGYKILENNFKTRYGEVDIIAEDKKDVVFIEVKNRSSMNYGLPQEAIDRRKQLKIAKTALMYLKSKNLINKNMRFDVVAITNEKIELIKNAFQIEGKIFY
ncbi:MAG: YraN family protein [Elusimicrobia bacterium RIFOXYA2_FULL_39_19]|nr:MAG: YraN family protein [Elusimicrobia bacterium RIFOXYA2_FULL_39_19]